MIRLSPLICKLRPRAWPQYLLLLAVIPLGNISAQDSAPGFSEVAAEAAAARDVNDAPRAIELYQQGLRLDPKWQDGWWSLGLLQYGSGAYAAATDALTHVLELAPDTGQALALRGLCEFETAAYQQSLADIQKGIALGAAGDARQEEILHFHQGMLLTRLGNFQEALRVYAPFAEHGLSSDELLIAIGLAGLHMPLLPKDVGADQRALLMSVGYATHKFMQGDQSGARQAFNEVFQHFPTVPNAHMLYGNLMYAFGPDAATPQFQKEVEIAPENPDALIMLAWSLLMQRRSDEALPYARHAAQKEPERASAQLVLGRALADTGDVTAGIEHLEHGLKLEPDNLELHIALARAYSKSGRDDDARRERTLCLQMTSNNATRLTHP